MNRYEEMIAALSNEGVFVRIIRTGYKAYNFIVNFEIIHCYKQRRSCNRALERYYKLYFSAAAGVNKKKKCKIELKKLHNTKPPRQKPRILFRKFGALFI